MLKTKLLLKTIYLKKSNSETIENTTIRFLEKIKR